MKRVGALKIKTAILCDDVRTEAETNKIFLIGVYTGAILLPRFPANVFLSFFWEVVVPPGKHKIEIRLSGPGKGSAVLEAHVEAGRAGEATLATPRLNVYMDEPGVFKIQARQPGQKRWVTIIEKAVEPNDSATASRQLVEQSPPDAHDSSSPREPSRRGSRRKREHS